MSEEPSTSAPAGLRTWARRGLDDVVAAALRLDDYPAARACANVAIFAHVLVATSLPASPAVDRVLATLETHITRLAAHRDALDPAAWSSRQQIETYTRQLERRAPDGHILAARLKRQYAVLYDLLPHLAPGEDVPDHSDASTVEGLVTELKDALGIA